MLSIDLLIVMLMVVSVFGTLVFMSECKYVGRSLIAFIFFTVLVAIIYLYLGAPIVAAFQVLIYSGAVVAFMLLALSMMREEVVEGPKITLGILTRFIVGFIALSIVLLVAYYYVPLNLLTLPNSTMKSYLTGSREYVVSFFMWGVRPVDVVILGVFTLVLAAGIRHFYKEIMKRG